MLTYGRIAAWLRISVKYDIPALIMKAMDEFGALFPVSFDAWYRSDGPLHDYDDYDERRQMIVWINLARQHRQHALLPAMFVNLCGLSEEEVTSGFTLDNGTTQHLAPEDVSRWGNLSQGLCGKVPSALYRLLEQFTPVCTEHPQNCSAGVASAAEIIEAAFFRAPGVPHDPFPRWKRYSCTMVTYGVCEVCECLLETRWKEELRAIWTTLHGIVNSRLSGEQQQPVVSVDTNREGAEV